MEFAELNIYDKKGNDKKIKEIQYINTRQPS